MTYKVKRKGRTPTHIVFTAQYKKTSTSPVEPLEDQSQFKFIDAVRNESEQASINEDALQALKAFKNKRFT